MSDKILKLSQAQTLYQDLRERIDALPTDSDIPEVPVQDVQINGTSILQNGVANVPVANDLGRLGVLRFVQGSQASGLTINGDGYIYIAMATSSSIKDGTNIRAPIVPSNQHESTFYGLAKAAGDSTQSVSTNAVGTYTDEAKTAIRSMLDVPATSDIPSVPVQDVQIDGASILSNGIANVPIMSASVLGVAKTNPAFGISINANGVLEVIRQNTNLAKAGVDNSRPVVSSTQHESVFYGLAKAAGDSTQSVSTNAVGLYTDDAKSAIQNMLNVPSKNEILFERGAGGSSIQVKANITTGSNIQKALGNNSFAEGANTVAAGTYSHASGMGTIAIGNCSHTEGNSYLGDGIKISGTGNTTTYTVKSYIAYIKIGDYLVIDNEYRQVIEVDINNNNITLNNSFNMDLNNTACRIYYGYAGGSCSHVEGQGTITKTDCQHVQGIYNILDTQNLYADIVGNGVVLGNRSNAYALEWTGTGRYAGDVYVGCDNDSTGGTRLATITEVAAKLDAAEAGLKVVRLI